MRVNPQELSIRDADFYDKVYVYGSVRLTDNYNHFVDGIDFQVMSLIDLCFFLLSLKDLIFSLHHTIYIAVAASPSNHTSRDWVSTDLSPRFAISRRRL